MHGQMMVMYHEYRLWLNQIMHLRAKRKIDYAFTGGRIQEKQRSQIEEVLRVWNGGVVCGKTHRDTLILNLGIPKEDHFWKLTESKMRLLTEKLHVAWLHAAQQQYKVQEEEIIFLSINKSKIFKPRMLIQWKSFNYENIIKILSDVHYKEMRHLRSHIGNSFGGCTCIWNRLKGMLQKIGQLIVISLGGSLLLLTKGCQEKGYRQKLIERTWEHIKYSIYLSEKDSIWRKVGKIKPKSIKEATYLKI